jgi:hypothetical protein
MSDLNGTFWAIILGSWTFAELDCLAAWARDTERCTTWRTEA